MKQKRRPVKKVDDFGSLNCALPGYLAVQGLNIETCHVYLVMFLQEGNSLRCHHFLVTNSPHKFELPVENDNPPWSRTGHDNVIPPGINGKCRWSLHRVTSHDNFGCEIFPPAISIFLTSRPHNHILYLMYTLHTEFFFAMQKWLSVTFKLQVILKLQIIQKLKNLYRVFPKEMFIYFYIFTF